MSALAGIRIAVTRPLTQAEELAAPLRALGAQVLVAPLIRIEPAPLTGALRQELMQLGQYDWLVFSSVNGVDLLVRAAQELGLGSALASARVACVGPATRAAAEQHGLRVDAMPAEFIGDAIADALAEHGSLSGARILLARAAGARSVLPARLREQGAEVTDLELYRSVLDESGAAVLRASIAADQVDALTFTSGSAAGYFSKHVGGTGKAVIAVIGPATAEAARAAQLNVDIEANPHTTEGLVQAIVRYFSERHSSEQK